MADKPEELETIEDKIAHGKEFFSSGSRNYYVNAYAEAVDDLSQACSLLAEHLGPTADDCALPYLIYAKTLIALNKDANKVLDVPNEEEESEEGEAQAEGEEDGEGEEGEGEENEEEGEAEEKEKENGDAEAAPEAEAAEKPESAAPSTENGTSENGTSKENGAGPSDEAEAVPGTSNEADEEEESGLQIAWEVLELAAIIFARQGEESLPNLAEALIELGGISMENSHFDVAIKDFLKALDVYDKMKEPSRRHIAELHFKIGLCHSFINEFESSFVALRKAIEVLDMEIEAEQVKEQTEEVKQNIKDLEETKLEIKEKITEIEEQKQESIEEVKKKLSEILSHDANAEDSDGPGPSKSDEVKPKPTDISHLIKRKKPDEGDAVQESPAKKPALDS